MATDERICDIPGCARPHRSKGLCGLHYDRLRRTGTTHSRPPRLCDVAECHTRHYANGLCKLHYDRKLRTGTTDDPHRESRRCEVDGCAAPHVAHGYCNKHLKRWDNHGDVNFVTPRGRKAGPLMDRWRKYVTEGDPGECWEWQGARNRAGYGVIALGAARRSVKAHRVSYEIYKGEIPEGLFICHTCDNPPCVNPSHLYAGTVQDNNWDRWHGGPAPRPLPAWEHPRGADASV